MKLSSAKFPDDLLLATWEKKKGTLPAESKLPEALKGVARLHGAVPFDEVKDGWWKAFERRAELDEAFSARDRGLRAKALPLKRALVDLAGDARKLLKDKGLPEATALACKKIAAAADKLADEIDEDLEALAREVQQVLKQLPDAEEEPEEPPALLLDPRRLLAQLTLCKKDGERRVRFAFVPLQDKRPAVLVMHPRIGAKALFAQVKRATDADKGAFGTAWVQDTVLYMQPDIRFSGLAKAARGPLKACGFRVSKVVLHTPDGKVDEEDASDEGSDEPTPEQGVGNSPSAPQDKPEDPGAAQECQKRLQALGGQLSELAKTAAPEARKLEPLLAFAQTKAQAGQYGAALGALNKLEQMLLAAADQALTAWNRRWDESDRRLFKATRRLPSAVSQLRPLLDLAQARGAARKFEDGERVLDQLDQRLQRVESDAQQKAKELAERLKPLLPDPPDLDSGETQELALLRQEVKAQLLEDVDLAAMQLDELAQRWQQLKELAEQRKALALQALGQALLELSDPPDLDLLPSTTLEEGRAAVRLALSKGDLQQAGDRLNQLRQLREQVLEQIDTARSGLVKQAIDELERLAAPEGSEDGEREQLTQLAMKVNDAIAEGRVRELASLVQALAQAHASVLEAIEQRLRLALSELEKDYKKVQVPEGATEEELGPSAEHRRQVEQALLDRQPQRGREALRELVLALRVVARSVRRRVLEQQARELSEQERLAEQRLNADRERSRVLREWIVEHLYGPNVELKRATGFMQPMQEVDDAYDLEALSEGDHAKLLLQLQTTWVPLLQQAGERARQVDERRTALDRRAKTLSRQITQSQDQDKVKVPKLPPGWAVPDQKNYAGNDAGQWLAKLRLGKLRVDTALGQLTHDPSREAGTRLADEVLDETRQLHLDFSEWVDGLGQWDSDKGATVKPLLLNCAGEYVDKGLRLSVVQGRYNAARDQRLPLRALKGQLEKDWADQREILAKDLLKILGLPSQFPALPVYEFIPKHLSYYPTVYKGGSKWPASDEDNTEDFRGKLLTALISNHRQSIHVTLEWTGEKDHINNLKCYRDGDDVAWNAGAGNYGGVAGRLTTSLQVKENYPDAHKLGEHTYPSTRDARAHVKEVLLAKVATIKERLAEMCEFRGLTRAEKTNNVSGSLVA